MTSKKVLQSLRSSLNLCAQLGMSWAVYRGYKSSFCSSSLSTCGHHRCRCSSSCYVAIYPGESFSLIHFHLADWELCHQFLLSSLDHQHDLYLAELKEMLWRIQGKKASVTTIERTLKQAGFTLKEVWVVFICCASHDLLLVNVRSARKHWSAAKLRGYNISLGLATNIQQSS